MGQSVTGDSPVDRLQDGEIATWQKAQQMLMSCRFDRAFSNYREITRTSPEFASLWFETGMAAAGNLDFSLSHACLQLAVSLAAKDASLLLLIAEQYQKIRMYAEARRCLERAVQADPKNIHCRLTLAAHLERERRVGDALECVAESLKMNPAHPGANYYRAFLLHRQGKSAEAETALRELLKKQPRDASVLQSSLHLLGVILDGSGRIREAMDCFKQSKAMLLSMPQARELLRTYDLASRQRKQLLASITISDVCKWQEEASGEPCHEIAFLGGHPRSGTTLIEQILGAHPGIHAFDEPEAFTMEILNAVSPPQSASGLGLNTLNSLSAAWRSELRERYFKSLLRELDGEVNGRLLLDKNPSPTASLFLWLRIFPKLKVIMPLRDPRDVVISCYQQNLALTSANVNFLTIERTVQHYCDLMDVWLRFKDIGGFDWIETRYEEMVADPDGEGRRVTEFLGREWKPEQSKFYDSARGRFVFAPTYHDVTKPAHGRSVGRWKAYAEFLAPHLARLDPYCEALGYETPRRAAELQPHN